MFRLTLLLVLGLLVPATALAQTPTADEDDGTFTTIRERAGVEIVAEASVSYEMSGISFADPLIYLFWATEFKSTEDAEKMMGIVRSDFPQAYIETNPVDAAQTTMSLASAPDLGDGSFAMAGEATSDGITVVIGVIFVRVGNVILAASSAALMGNMVEIAAPFAESMVSAIEESEDLADVLPSLDDMPPGYIVSD